MDPSNDRKMSQQQKFIGAFGSNNTKGGDMAQGLAAEFPSELYIFQKDSRTISIFDIKNKSCVHKFVDFKGNFPHNFQMIQVGLAQPRVFMIGGGDYKTLPDSMF